MKLQLSMATAANLRTRPIMDGAVTADGIDIIHTPLHPLEMSVSSLIKAIAAGNDQWVGIPVFTTHEFFQTRILVRRDVGINRPEDLAGIRANRETLEAATQYSFEQGLTPPPGGPGRGVR